MTAAHRYLPDKENPSSVLDGILISSSVSLAKCSAATVDGVIVSTLRELCRAEDADDAGWILIPDSSRAEERCPSVLTSGIIDRVSCFHSGEFPWCKTRLLEGLPILMTNLTGLPEEAETDRRNLHRLGIKSLAVIPIDAGETNHSALTLSSVSHANAWSATLEKHCALLGSAFLSAHARKVTHQQKEMSDANFRELFRSASIAMAIEDTSGGLLYVNEALCTMLGWGESEMIRKRCADFSHPADQPREAILFEKLLGGELQSYNIEKRFLHRTGAIVWAKVTVTQLQESSNGSRLILGIAENITSQKNAVEKLATSQMEVRSLASRLILSQEDERRSLARELHDDIGQRLSLVTSEIHLLKAGPAIEDPPRLASLDRLSEELDALVTDLHNLSYRLHSAKLQHLGVRSAFRELCRRLANSGVSIDVTLGENLEPMPEEITLCLLRVAQEALNNVVKHSGVTRAGLTLSRTITGYYLLIEDGGKGFDEDVCPKGLGLISMRERVRLLQGDLVIRSVRDHGTKVVAWLPLPGSER